MKIPQTFVSDRNLEEKMKQLITNDEEAIRKAFS